jgi:hypothetical protein
MARDLRQLSTEEKALRDELRSVTLGSPAVHAFKIVQWTAAGKTVDLEVRAPSLATQAKIEKLAVQKGERDNIKALFAMVIHSVFIPGTDIQVFEIADEAVLSERGVTKDFVGLILRAITALGEEATLENAEKKS